MSRIRGWRVLVTGAAGFVGATLTRSLLEGGAAVHGVVRSSTDLWRIEEVRSKMRLHCLDLSDPKAVESTVEAVRPKVIFHLAAASGHPSSPGERAEALQSTVLGTSNLLEAVRELNFHRFVHLGSGYEYGPRDRLVNESDTLQPAIFRGVVKAAATVLVQQFARSTRLPFTVLRPSSIYGYWESDDRFIPTLIRAAMHNRELPLTPPGIRRDFLFVEDLIEACLRTLHAEKLDGEIINIASGREWANEEVVEAMQSVSGQPIKVRVGAYPTRAVDSPHQLLDIRKAKAFLGWTPRHDLRQGLEKTLVWYRAHENLYASR